MAQADPASSEVDCLRAYAAMANLTVAGEDMEALAPIVRSSLASFDTLWRYDLGMDVPLAATLVSHQRR